MKKLFILAMALMISVMAHAQFSVQAGYLMNSIRTEVGGVTATQYYDGVSAAVDYNIPLVGSFSVAPGLGLGFYFTNKYDIKYRGLGLFVPIDFNLCVSDRRDFKVSIFAGPTLYYGLFSKNILTNSHYDYYELENKRFELALGGGLWCDVKECIRVKIGYKFGVTDNSKIKGITEKNNTLSLSIGYLF